MPFERHPWAIGLVIAAMLVAASLAAYAMLARDGDEPPVPTAAPTTATTGGPGTTREPSTTATTEAQTTSTASTSTTTTTEPPPPMHEWVDARTVGEPWAGPVEGFLTFRGNPTSTWYGTGPIPETPQTLWRYPDAPMGSKDFQGVPWTGVTWTGQPIVWERPDGITEMIFGATDNKVHFIDPETGEELRESFRTGGHIKGTPTLDPDGYPLLYFGARDRKLRVVALDREQPTELWSFNSDSEPQGRWWHDWDASPRVLNDILFEGSENSFFYIWKLNRAFGRDGAVTVEPVLLFKMKTWTADLLSKLGGYSATSVENSAAIFEGTVYFANGGGRVIGLDIETIVQGTAQPANGTPSAWCHIGGELVGCEAPIVLDYWVGDDVDASIVVDEEGMLYVSAEYERYNSRSRELGQLVKLDPTQPDDPYIWGMFSLTNSPYKGGIWASPALGDCVLYVVTNKGFLVAVDRETGEEVWVQDIGSGDYTQPRHMSSPLIVDDHLIVAIRGGYLHSYSLADPREPVLEWSHQVTPGEIEASPAAWEGTVFIGSRDGYMYAIGE